MVTFPTVVHYTAQLPRTHVTVGITSVLGIVYGHVNTVAPGVDNNLPVLYMVRKS